jgi:hypothetical protein
MKKAAGKILVGALFALGLGAVPMPGHAQLPASPRRFVDFLDVRCYQITNQPPLNVTLVLKHLNPVLQNLPTETVVLQSPQQLCVPVQKETQIAPADTAPFIKFVDWKCYGIDGPSVDFPLALTQLNPVAAAAFGPNLNVILRKPQQLCVPVVKNNVNPPANVLQLVQWLDVKCYGIDPVQNIVKPITLTHLNPLFATLPKEVSQVGVPGQVCVPVTKNGATPPAAILPYIQYADVLCYRASGAPLGQNLALKHINPVLTAMGLPQENVFIGNSLKLCVPVAKNGVFPPGNP